MVRALADSEHRVVWAGCGREHTLVALASGGVYSWGWGEGGRLGLGEVDAVLSPRRVEEVRPRKLEGNMTDFVFISLGVCLPTCLVCLSVLCVVCVGSCVA